MSEFRIVYDGDGTPWAEIAGGNVRVKVQREHLDPGALPSVQRAIEALTGAAQKAYARTCEDYRKCCEGLELDVAATLKRLPGLVAKAKQKVVDKARSK